MDTSMIIGLALGIAIGIIGMYFFAIKSRKSLLKKGTEELEILKDKELHKLEKAKNTLKSDKREFELELKEKSLEAEKVINQKLAKLDRRDHDLKSNEKQLKKTERNLDKRDSELDGLKKTLEDFEKALSSRENDIEKRIDEVEDRRKDIEIEISNYQSKLEDVAGMTRDQAKEELVSSMVNKAKIEAEKLAMEIRENAKDDAKKEAKKIIALAIQKCAVDHTVETTVSTVSLPSDEMKGRIIGRTGRNIRAFENATGVDIIVDDTPEVVILSSFDPIRREIAKITLEKLISDGRIHPTRIEELISKSEEEIAEKIKETGQQTLLDLGITGVHPEIIKTIGKLQYRTSYGQNILQHSIEVAYLCGFMASELGLNSATAMRAGLLHDIGKAVDREQEGTHALIGGEIGRKYGETDLIVNAIESHHEEREAFSIYAYLVTAADAISSSRPGARRETLETYVKRVKQLEEIAKSYAGVNQCFAVQAGREIRVIVEPNKVNDSQSSILAKDIATQIENDMQYPGNIKVNVIREVRYSDYAN